jgi:hypothetical protein
VYLTKKERDGLASLAAATGRKQSELIREAVDRLIEQSSGKSRQTALERAAGMWKGRKDLPDFRALRRELDRDGPHRSGTSATRRHVFSTRPGHSRHGPANT